MCFLSRPKRERENQPAACRQQTHQHGEALSCRKSYYKVESREREWESGEVEGAFVVHTTTYHVDCAVELLTMMRLLLENTIQKDKLSGRGSVAAVSFPYLHIQKTLILNLPLYCQFRSSLHSMQEYRNGTAQRKANKQSSWYTNASSSIRTASLIMRCYQCDHEIGSSLIYILYPAHLWSALRMTNTYCTFRTRKKTIALRCLVP